MKQVIDQPQTTVRLKDINPNKIYASVVDQGVYKLQRMSGRWMFCEQNGSNLGSYGAHGTAEMAIRAELDHNPVYEFDSVEEFLAWALDIVRKGKK